MQYRETTKDKDRYQKTEQEKTQSRTRMHFSLFARRKKKTYLLLSVAKYLFSASCFYAIGDQINHCWGPQIVGFVFLLLCELYLLFDVIVITENRKFYMITELFVLKHQNSIFKSIVNLAQLPTSHHHHYYKKDGPQA